MHRSRVVRLVAGAAMMVALLLPSTALASSAGGGVATRLAPTAEALPRIGLGCALFIVNPLGPAEVRRAIACRWSAPAGVEVKEYRLWRVVDLRPRRLIATIPAGETLRHADKDIARGHTYTYRVVAVGTDGTRVALSNRVSIRVGRPAEEIRLGCAFVVDADRSGVACHWSASTRPAAVRYVLIRSVDGGPRERIYRTGLNGPRRFFDTDVKAGQSIRYAVLVLAADGRVVGHGGPDTVLVPTIGAAAIAR